MASFRSPAPRTGYEYWRVTASDQAGRAQLTGHESNSAQFLGVVQFASTRHGFAGMRIVLPEIPASAASEANPWQFRR